MSIQVNKFTNNNRKIINTLENFSVIEHEKDMTVINRVMKMFKRCMHKTKNDVVKAYLRIFLSKF